MCTSRHSWCISRKFRRRSWLLFTCLAKLSRTKGRRWTNQVSRSIHQSLACNISTCIKFFSDTSSNYVLQWIWIVRDLKINVCTRKKNIMECMKMLVPRPTPTWKKYSGNLFPGARLSKVPIINGPSKLSPFTLKIEVSIVLHLTW